jgi:hypothetical protein
LVKASLTADCTWLMVGLPFGVRVDDDRGGLRTGVGRQRAGGDQVGALDVPDLLPQHVRHQVAQGDVEEGAPALATSRTAMRSRCSLPTAVKTVGLLTPARAATCSMVVAP